MKIIVYLFLSVFLFAGCEKEDIETYSAGNYIQFTKSYADSTRLSFFFYSGQDQIRLPIELKLVGAPLKKATSFGIVAVEGETTAAGSHYVLPKECKFKANQDKDTVYLILKNAPDLLTKEVRLVIELTQENELHPGQLMYTRLVYRISDMITQPEWWDEGVEKSYLGKYTEKKYREFMKVTGVGIIDDNNKDQLWALSLKFKYYLREMKDKGTPVQEEDGADMLAGIPVLG